MQRFFVKNLLFVLAVNLLVKPVWVLVIDRTVQNRVGHADYGTYQALLNLGLIFNILLDFGLSYYNTRILSGEPGKLKTLFPAVLTARLTLVGIYAGLVLITAWAAGYRGTEVIMLCGILAIQTLNSLMLFLRSNVSALHKFRLDGLLSVTDRLLMIVFCGALLFLPATRDSFSISWFVWSQVACLLIAVILAVAVLKQLAGISFRLSRNMQEVGGIIRKSVPYATLVFLMAVHMRADTILLERFSGADAKKFAGIYAAAYRLLDVGNMFGIMFAGMLLPMFGRMLAQKNNIQPIVKLSVNIMLPFAFMAAAAAIWLGTNIMQLLYTHSDAYNGQVFAWLMACFPAYCIMYVYSTLLTANNNLLLLNKIAAAGVVLNLSLNAWLIPRHQALGAAQAAFVTQWVLAACYIFFSGKKLLPAMNLKWMAAHISYIILLLAGGYAAVQLPISWPWQLAVLTAWGLLLIFVFRFISPGQIRSLAERG